MIVLVVVALLSLGAYTFSEMMMIEAQATGMYGRQVQTRAMADSGVELVSALLGDSLIRVTSGCITIRTSSEPSR